MASRASKTRPPHILFHLTLLLTFGLTFTLRSDPTMRLDAPICARAPLLQTLDAKTFMKDYMCVLNKTTSTLNCSHGGISALPKTQYMPEGVQVLDFTDNRIMCLPQINDTVSTCSSTNCGAGCVKELRLGQNEIEYLHPEVFTGLPCLTALDLSENRIENRTLMSQHFAGLVHLGHLDLHGNPLYNLQDSVLVSAYMSQLHTLNLSSCQLRRVGPASLDNFFELQVLDLSRNQLKSLAQTTFQGHKELRLLDLSWNELHVIEKKVFGDMWHLTELRLHHNRLSLISEEAFFRSAPLPTLDLSWNRFTDIPYYTVSTLTHLQALDLSHNPIISLGDAHVTTSVRRLRLDYLTYLEEVEDDAFSAFPGLSALSLRYAPRLTAIPPSAFRGSSANLSEVRLEGNGFTFLDQELLPWQRLRMLTLHGNPWHCDCVLSWAAGYRLGNTTMRCDSPLKLKGQELESLQPDELSCPVDTLTTKAFIALSLIATVLAIVWLIVWKRRRSLPCRCVRGTDGRYITVYTKHLKDDDDDDGTCGQGQVDDLDLGNGEAGGAGSSEGGRVMILLNTFRKGYRRLNTRDSESTQDLSLAADV